MPLYGHELSEEIDPFQAGLGYTCYLTGYDFPGRDALKRREKEPLDTKLVGLELEGRRPARGGCDILARDEPVGRTTSGTYSPTLKRPIALGYVRIEYAEPGTELAIDVRGRKSPARVVKLPFYRRRKGSHR
jgi:aminomethyltransferase